MAPDIATPAFWRCFSSACVEVHATWLDVHAQEASALETLLDENELERANGFVFAQDRMRFVVRRARLRQMLGQRMGVPPEEVTLLTGPQGKPALAPSHGRNLLQFNVSHSGALAVYAFAWGTGVGVDVEALQPLENANSLVETFFSPQEKKTFETIAAQNRTEAFFNAWTRKEAFVKALGQGLYLALDSFDVEFGPGKEPRIMRIDSQPGAQGNWVVSSFAPAPGFVTAVVHHTAAKPLPLVR